MANQYFGNIGDVWKHLALAEILRNERPELYVESHCGMARNVPGHDDTSEHAAGRKFGFEWFRSKAEDPLKQSEYFKQLQTHAPDYPGSPAIAMKTLSSQTKFRFCDTDDKSLADVVNYAKWLGISEVETNKVDGVAYAMNQPTQWLTQNALFFVDPFKIGSIDCSKLLGVAPGKLVVWQGTDDIAAAEFGLSQFAAKCTRAGIMRQFGGSFEARFVVDEQAFNAHPNELALRQHGLVCFGLTAESRKRVAILGQALEELYSRHSLANNKDFMRFRLKDFA